jgi:hypothetical protein
MAIRLNTADYAQLNESINTLLASGKYSAVVMNVYTDEAAANLATDSNGIISQRKIASVNAVYTHVDTVTGQQMNGYLTIKFTDGSTVISTDNVSNYWYTLDGNIFVPKRWGA